MTEPSDAQLYDRLQRLTAAVPVDPDETTREVGTTSSVVGRATFRLQIAMSTASLVAIAVLAVVGAGLLSVGRPSGPDGDSGAVPSKTPTSSPTAVPTENRAPAFPDSCGNLGLTINMCAGFAAWAIGQAGIQPGHVQQIEVTKVECPGGSACSTGAIGYLVDVYIVTDLGGSSHEVHDCSRRPGTLGGIDFLCSTIMTGDGRLIQYPGLGSPISGGYRDTPCSGEGPVGCATPLPTIDSSALADSVSLTIASMQIPIDHAGTYSVVLGQASLPNGVLSAASAKVTSSPTNPLVAYEGYRLTITSLDGGPPFDNYYAHGWRPGTERVEVTLTFTVLMFEPGAQVVVEGIEVH